MKVAVVGATGLVGSKMLEVLAQRNFPVTELIPVASEKSVGKTILFKDIPFSVCDYRQAIDAAPALALFSAGGSTSLELAPRFAEAGITVIDNSSAWRMDPDKKLVVPEVNGQVLTAADKIIANPNCSTIQLVCALNPLHQAAGLKRVVVSTYQSVSGAGQKGLSELSEQVTALFSQQQVEAKHFPHQIAFNCIPQIDLFEDNGYTKEEMKVIRESRKILGQPALKITATAVRVPVFACHAESVNIEFERALTPDQARQVLRESPGVIVIDNPEEKLYPLNIDVVGTDATYVGRIRKDESVEHGVNLWVVADNLRKGAALNAVQIAEVVVNFLQTH
jgi:aspartate-semialdehyde dehydrogenase